MTTSCVFIISNYVISFWYSDLHVLISELIQSKSALNHRCSVLNIQCIRAKRWFYLKHRCSAPNFSVLNSPDSENIKTDQFCFRADQSWCFSCSLNQRWKTSNLGNNAVQRCISLGLLPGIYWVSKYVLITRICTSQKVLEDIGIFWAESKLYSKIKRSFRCGRSDNYCLKAEQISTCQT